MNFSDSHWFRPIWSKYMPKYGQKRVSAPFHVNFSLFHVVFLYRIIKYNHLHSVHIMIFSDLHWFRPIWPKYMPKYGQNGFSPRFMLIFLRFMSIFCIELSSIITYIVCAWWFFQICIGSGPFGPNICPNMVKKRVLNQFFFVSCRFFLHKVIKYSHLHSVPIMIYLDSHWFRPISSKYTPKYGQKPVTALFHNQSNAFS